MGKSMSITSNDIHFAIDVANNDYHNHTADTFRHWSFVYQKGRLLEWSRNKLNDPVGFERYGYQGKRHSLHAEALAMRKAYGLLDRRKPWVMLNIRLGAGKELRNATPCRICRSFIAACGCSECYFSIDGNIAKIDL